MIYNEKFKKQSTRYSNKLLLEDSIRKNNLKCKIYRLIVDKNFS